MKKKTLSLLLSIFLLFLFITGCKTKPSTVYFLKNYGQVLMDEDNETVITLLFGIKNKNMSTEKIYSAELIDSIYINENIEVDGFSIEFQYKTKDVDFYAIHFDLKAHKESKMESLLFRTQNGEFFYDIGTIYVDLLKDTDKTDYVQVKGHDSARIGGKELASYSVDLISKKEIDVYFDLKHFEQFLVETRVFREPNDTDVPGELVNKNYVKINGDLSQLSFEFSDKNRQYDAYFFYPKLTYKIKNKEHQIWVGYCSYGITLEEQDLDELAKKI